MSLSPNGSTPSDEALMARVQNGDTDAFAELYDRHAIRAFQVARAICSDTGRAEDAVQDGFLAIWTSRARFNPENGSFKAWSTSILKNRAIDSYRAAAARPPLQSTEARSEEADAEARSVQDRVVARSETDAMLASLCELPAAQAEVIALAFFGELSHSEIAAMLDLPSGTVKGRMRLGLEKLRKRMGVRT
jgi:RNA polymerase sigma-70 factor (ECF subfamily)